MTNFYLFKVWLYQALSIRSYGHAVLLRCCLLLPLIGVYSISSTAQTKYHVNAANGNDTNTGLSWNAAFETLQKAIETTVEGDSIWVAKGRYMPSVAFDVDEEGGAEEREKTFYINKNIKIYGSFAGTEMVLSERMLGQDTTFLDGLLSATDSAYHVIYIDGSTNSITNEMILDGVAICNGRANGQQYQFNSFGGAILILARNGGVCSPSIVNATFYNNSAGAIGGAIYNSAGGDGTNSPSIINSTFYNNSSGGDGGAISNETLNGSTNNSIIINSTFYNNSATIRGGAIFNLGFSNAATSSPIIVNSTFYNNSASEGGAICNFGLRLSSTSNPSIINSTFYNNSAATSGGAIFSFGRQDGTSSPMIKNSIFWNNKKEGSTGTAGADIEDGDASSTTISHSLTQENSSYSTGTGIINNQDPQFVDAEHGDVRLVVGSPAIDMGDNTAIPMGVTTDLGGNMRIQEGTVDLGAFEGGIILLPKKYHVKIGGNDTNDGLSWNNAFETLQKAIETTAEGDTIWVAKGRYMPSVAFDADDNGTTDNREKTFYIDKNIKIYGSFAGTEMTLSERMLEQDTTFLDGALSAMDSAYHVVYIDGKMNAITNEMILDGFAICHGRADGEHINSFGGGIFNDGRLSTSSPSIVNATFYNNSANAGGAICNEGTIYGISSPSIVNATFYNNSAGGGGAIFNTGDNNGESSPSITNATFYNNSAIEGGAIYNYGTYGTSSPSIVNATFYNNSATTGGAIINSDATPIIKNSIFWNNKKNNAVDMAGADIDISDNGDTPSIITISHSLTQENSTYSTGTGIINNQDPQFVDAINGDFRLVTSSPAIDKGDNTVIPMGITTDLGGNMRIQEGTVDLGAFEGGVILPKKYHVKIGGADTNDGLSWSNAFATLQKAIETAEEGDIIWVAKGRYIPSVAFDGNDGDPVINRDQTFYIDKNIKIYGSFAGTEMVLSERILGQDTTFLDGALSAMDSVYHVVYIDGRMNAITNEMILDGFAICHGRADGGEFFSNIGGGIFNDGRGDGTGNPSIVNTTFYNNSAIEGGAIYNFGPESGGTSSPSIINATFYNNSASSGGAIYNSGAYYGESSPSIVNATFYNNSATNEGGAIYNSGEEGTSNPSIVNTTFYNNSATNEGGAIYNKVANSIIQNSIFWNNKKNNAVDIAGADIFDEMPAPVIFDGFSTTISHSLTQKNSIFSSETGIINNQDPQFVAAKNGDFRLQNCSPAINTGTTPDPAVPMDILGNARMGAYDLGAYEFQDTPIQVRLSAPTVTQPTCEIATGTIVINARATRNAALQYSVDNGMNWQDNKTFSEQAAGSYTIKTRLKNSTPCEEVYTNNPVVLSAATNCCPTMVSAGVDTSVCNSIYTLRGSTLQTGETGEWIFVTNPDNKATLSNSTSATAMVNVNFATEDIFESNSISSHTVMLQWKVTNGSCSAGVSDEVTITLTPPVSAGLDRLGICGTTINLGATPASDGTGSWTFVTNPNNSGSLDDASKPNAILTGIIGGNYELEWMVTGGVCNGSMDRITVAFQPDSDGDTVQDCKDLCEGGDDSINSDNTGMPDACDCNPDSEEGEFVMIASSDLDANSGQNPSEMIADFQINSTAIVKATPTHPATIFKAGNNIVLEAGFHAQVGSDFTAIIGPCKTPPAPLVEEEQSNNARSKHIVTIPTRVFDLRVQPNLIQSEATVFLDLSATQDIELMLYDQTGRLVRTFLNTTQAAGSHQFLLRTDYLQSGMYLLQLRSATDVITKKIIVQR